MRHADSIITVVSSIVDGMTPVVTITANVAEGDYWKLSMCNTYWLMVDMRITIGGETFRVREVVQNDYIVVSGTAQPVGTTFQLEAPEFWHGSHRKVNSERSAPNKHDVSKVFVYLPIPDVRENDGDDDEIEYEATIRPIFLTGYNKQYDKIDLQQEMYIEPCNAMADVFLDVIEENDTIIERPTNIERREWMNFGDESVWGKDKLIFNQNLSGVESRMRIGIFYGDEACCVDGEFNACMPVNIYINGTQEDTVESGQDYQLTVVDTNGDEQGVYDEPTKTIVVPAPGGGGGTASQTFNGTSVTDQDSGTTKVITVKDSGGTNVGTKGTDTALALAITIDDVTVDNSNVTWTTDITAEGTFELPDTTVQLQVDGVNYGAPVSVVTLDPNAILEIQW